MFHDHTQELLNTVMSANVDNFRNLSSSLVDIFLTFAPGVDRSVQKFAMGR